MNIYYAIYEYDSHLEKITLSYLTPKHVVYVHFCGMIFSDYYLPIFKQKQFSVVL